MLQGTFISKNKNIIYIIFILLSEMQTYFTCHKKIYSSQYLLTEEVMTIYIQQGEEWCFYCEQQDLQ